MSAIPALGAEKRNFTFTFKDNKPIVLPSFLMLLHAKDIWPNMHVFQHGCQIRGYNNNNNNNNIDIYTG